MYNYIFQLFISQEWNILESRPILNLNNFFSEIRFGFRLLLTSADIITILIAHLILPIHVNTLLQGVKWVDSCHLTTENLSKRGKNLTSQCFFISRPRHQNIIYRWINIV